MSSPAHEGGRRSHDQRRRSRSHLPPRDGAARASLARRDADQASQASQKAGATEKDGGAGRSPDGFAVPVTEAVAVAVFRGRVRDRVDFRGGEPDACP